MTKLDKLRDLVFKLYESDQPNQAELAKWLYKNHVPLVAEEAGKLAERFSIDKDMSVAAALLHDIADAVMDRFDPKHEEESFRIARELLSQTGYTEEEIKIIVDDAMKYHSCYSKEDSPKTEVGKVLATADAIVHINSDYYPWLAEVKAKDKPGEKMKEWLLPKLERDFNLKIQFPEILVEQKPNYEQRKKEISTLKFARMPIK